MLWKAGLNLQPDTQSSGVHFQLQKFLRNAVRLLECLYIWVLYRNAHVFNENPLILLHLQLQFFNGCIWNFIVASRIATSLRYGQNNNFAIYVFMVSFCIFWGSSLVFLNDSSSSCVIANQYFLLFCQILWYFIQVIGSKTPVLQFIHTYHLVCHKISIIRFDFKPIQRGFLHKHIIFHIKMVWNKPFEQQKIQVLIILYNGHKQVDMITTWKQNSFIQFLAIWKSL